MLAVLISILLGVVSIFASLYVKAELEIMFNRRKKISLLHFVNVCITNVVIACSYYIFSGIFTDSGSINSFKEFYYIYLGSLQIMLPFYVVASILFDRYLEKQKKYTTSKDKKVLYIKEKYLSSRGNSYKSKSS